MTEIIEALDLPDDEVKRRVASMTMQERQKLIDDFRRAGQSRLLTTSSSCWTKLSAHSIDP